MPPDWVSSTTSHSNHYPESSSRTSSPLCRSSMPWHHTNSTSFLSVSRYPLFSRPLEEKRLLKLPLRSLRYFSTSKGCSHASRTSQLLRNFVSELSLLTRGQPSPPVAIFSPLASFGRLDPSIQLTHQLLAFLEREDRHRAVLVLVAD